MKLFKMAIQNGKMVAPAMIVIAENEEKAEITARKESGLGNQQPSALPNNLRAKVQRLNVSGRFRKNLLKI